MAGVIKGAAILKGFKGKKPKRPKLVPCTFVSIDGEKLRLVHVTSFGGPNAYNMRDEKGQFVKLGRAYALTLDPRDKKKPLYKTLQESSKDWNEWVLKKTHTKSGDSLILGKLQGDIDYSIDIEPVMENVVVIGARIEPIQMVGVKNKPNYKDFVIVQAVAMDNLTYIKMVALKRRGL